MKKNIVLVVAMMISTIMYAQHGGGKHHHKGSHDSSETMKSVLSLDDNQYATIKGINKKYADKRHEARKDSTKKVDDKRSSFQSMRTEREKEIQNVLTDAQKTKWTSYQAERKTMNKEHREKFRKEHEANVKAALSLTDDQSAKLQKVDGDFFKSMKGMRRGEEGNKEKFESARKDHEAAVKSILSPEQFTKWQEMKKESRKGRHHKGRGKK